MYTEYAQKFLEINMFTLLYRLLIVFSLLSCNAAVAAGYDNPFAKNDRINIGKDISWKIDQQAVLATKSTSDDKGVYYHLGYDNKQITLALSDDAKGLKLKQLSQLEVINVKVDGKQAAIFKWCLNNQERHKRFLQQGLSVKNNVCVINDDGSSFIMRLNKDTLQMLQQAKRLSIMIKPFRTPLELNYDISDFADMTLALNTRIEKTIIAVPENKKPEKEVENRQVENRKCWAGPPAEYKNIKSVEYDCLDEASRKDAEAWVTKLVVAEKAKRQASRQSAQVAKKKAAEKKRAVALEKERKRKLAETNKKKRLAEKALQNTALQAETAAIAASQANQLKINDNITQKMVNVCKKYWDKGEHRCYCQKYIEHAPSNIRANSSCK